MKERPILFSGPMVRAILDGRKTQTRRVVKPQPFANGEVRLNERFDAMFTAGDVYGTRNPYGQPGDHLWVKETHRFDGLDPKIALRSQCLDEISYRADMDGDRSIDDCPWRPSIFMPRWASRITLEITGVRVERLNDISEEDAKVEGVECVKLRFWKDYDGKGGVYVNPILSFQSLWESINGPGSWDANPWAWVIEFRRGR